MVCRRLNDKFLPEPMLFLIIAPRGKVIILKAPIALQDNAFQTTAAWKMCLSLIGSAK